MDVYISICYEEVVPLSLMEFSKATQIMKNLMEFVIESDIYRVQLTC